MQPAMSDSGAIQKRVNAIIVDQLGCEPTSLAPEASLLDDLGADSLDVVELVMALEEEFSIEVPDDDVENIRTIGDVISYVGAKAQASA